MLIYMTADVKITQTLPFCQKDSRAKASGRGSVSGYIVTILFCTHWIHTGFVFNLVLQKGKKEMTLFRADSGKMQFLGAGGCFICVICDGASVCSR